MAEAIILQSIPIGSTTVERQTVLAEVSKDGFLSGTCVALPYVFIGSRAV